MSSNVLAVDQGTSGTKAVVVCPERGVIGSASVEVRPRYGDDGGVEVDAESLLSSVVRAGRQALLDAGEPVVAMGLANQGETVLAWDLTDGRPLTPAIVWQDGRSAPVCRALADDAAWLTTHTGLPLDPYFAAPKMAWLRQTMTREGVVTTSDSWLVHRLCGAFVTDASTASRTMLLDLDTTTWSPRALETFGLGAERLPHVVDCAQPVGETSLFGAPIPVTGLVVDQQAALLAQSCLRAGEAKCTYGTGAFLLANVGGVDAHGAALRSSAGLSTSVAWRLGGLAAYCVDGQVYTVASAVRWLADLGVITGAGDLDAVGAGVGDAGGVQFVPALAGLAAPYWRSEATGSLTGLTLATTAGHVVRALVEGIAAQVADLADAVAADLGGPLGSLRVDGGLTRSRLLMQAQADLLQAPVEVYASPDATALGAAALARLGVDAALAVEDVVAPSVSAVYEPAIDADEAAARRARFRAAVQAGVR